MKKHSWTAELETGISAIDLDHRALLGLINNVIAASEDANLDGLRASLIDLKTEMLVHFEREEQLMTECGYEAAAQHQEEHRQLTEEIQDQINDLDTGKGNVSFIARFMRNWFLQHIVTKDALFGKALLTQNGTTDRRQETADETNVFYERRMGNLETTLWNPSLALGIDAIDAHHRAMIDTLNAVIATRQSGDTASLARLLEQLGNETADDFQVEEQLMSRFSFEDAAAHIKEHRQFLDEFANQVDEWRENRISSELLCRFVYHWLVHHIADQDKALAEAIYKQNPRINLEFSGQTSSHSKG